MSRLHANPAGRRPVVRCTTFRLYSSDPEVIVARKGRDEDKKRSTGMTRCRPPAHRARLLEPAPNGSSSRELLPPRLTVADIGTRRLCRFGDRLAGAVFQILTAGLRSRQAPPRNVRLGPTLRNPNNFWVESSAVPHYTLWTMPVA